MEKNIQAVIIEPDRIPRPIWITNDILALDRAVNINWKGEPHPESATFEISIIKDDINIISSPKGEERHLPVTRQVGRYLKFYGIIYIVKMKGFNLVSMSQKEVVDYCMKFMNDTVSMESLGYPAEDYSDEDDNTSYSGRVEITFDDE